jgi:rhodanese-related sulfurtransferase
MSKMFSRRQLWVLLPLAAIAVGSPSLSAQSKTSAPASKVLSCKADSFGPDSIASPSIEQFKPDHSCAFDIPSQASLPKTAMLLDVRSPGEFNRSHIDGAMNLSPAEILTKDYLKSRQVILVGSGRDDHQLLKTCAQLKQRGFSSVKVIRGGMLSWSERHLPVLGDAIAIDQTRSLNAMELLAISRIEGVPILLAPGAMAYTRWIPSAVDIADLSSEKVSPRGKKINLLAAVIVSSRFPAPETFMAAKQKFGDIPILWNNGDSVAFDQAVQIQHASDRKKGRSGGSNCAQ